MYATADIISTVEFDHTGDYLATGDKGGRVVLFERNEQVSHGPKIHFRLAPIVDSMLMIIETGLRVQVLYRGTNSI
jgi:hypothetical protein